MCGICGRYNFSSREPVAAGLLQAMCSRLAHRGPDGEGHWQQGPAGLGHRRLVVIDPATGDQPLYSEDGSIVLVANGEIYNYRELNSALQARGHQLATASDCEPIIHLYEEVGLEFVHRLRGMFALALFDRARGRLILARDRLGKKPLHYYLGQGGIAFASELYALCADPEVPREVNAEALCHYLAHLYVPQPLSMLEGVGRVPPGHLLVCEREGPRLVRYWQPRYQPKDTRPRAEQVDELECLLTEAVRLRLRSDVPLGAFLSGGLDSALVTAFMVREAGEVRTFTLGFTEEGFNELEDARATAQALGTKHAEMVVEPDAAGCLPALVRRFGEPFADASALPTYYLAQFARREVTVALCGDGGDENFAGYERYRQFMRRWAEGKPYVWEAVARLAPPVGHFYSLPRRARRRWAISRLAPEQAYAYLVQYMPRELQRMLCSRWFLERTSHLEPGLAVRHAFAGVDSDSLLDRALGADVATYLPDDLLVKMDITSMAWGLESRSPLLDQEVVEFAARLPAAAKWDGHHGKVILRELAARLLPGEVLRRPKHGFSVPVDAWLRGPLAGMARDLVVGGLSGRGYFREGALERLLAWQKRSPGYGDLVWGLMVLELWHREILDA